MQVNLKLHELFHLNEILYNASCECEEGLADMDNDYLLGVISFNKTNNDIQSSIINSLIEAQRIEDKRKKNKNL